MNEDSCNFNHLALDLIGFRLMKEVALRCFDPKQLMLVLYISHYLFAKFLLIMMYVFLKWLKLLYAMFSMHAIKLPIIFCGAEL